MDRVELFDGQALREPLALVQLGTRIGKGFATGFAIERDAGDIETELRDSDHLPSPSLSRVILS